MVCQTWSAVIGWLLSRDSSASPIDCSAFPIPRFRSSRPTVWPTTRYNTHQAIPIWRKGGRVVLRDSLIDGGAKV